MTIAMPVLETRSTILAFALRLRDRLTLTDALLGNVVVTAGTWRGLRKANAGTYLFFDLPDGPTTFTVRSTDATPYYRAVDIQLNLPVGSALWPAYPDIGLADLTLPLASPAQPAAYRTQFLACALTPDIAYPFDPEATLVRGVVKSAGGGVADATVRDVAGDALAYLTGPTGEFVLAYLNPPVANRQVTIRTQRQGQPDIDTPVTIRRGLTTVATINV